MSPALIAALNDKVGDIGVCELKGLQTYLLAAWRRRGSRPDDPLVEEQRALTRSIERRHTDPAQLDAALVVATKYAMGLFASSEVSGRPVCGFGCTEDLLLVQGDETCCAMCLGPVGAEVSP